MGSDGQSPSTPDAIPFGTLKGSRAPRDGLRRAKPVHARRDSIRDPERVPRPPRWAPTGKARLPPTRFHRDPERVPRRIASDRCALTGGAGWSKPGRRMEISLAYSVDADDAF